MTEALKTTVAALLAVVLVGIAVLHAWAFTPVGAAMHASTTQSSGAVVTQS